MNNKVIILLLLVVGLFVFTINIPCGCNESFYNGPGTGKSFGFYNHPKPKCLEKNNCFRGSYVKY